MAAVSNQARLILQDENLEVRQKKAAFDGKTKDSKGVAKKGREGIRARKPLGDLTNKKDVHAGVTTKKLTAPLDEFNVVEECFLHDHNKCIEANNATLKLSLLDLVLPKCKMEFIDSRESMQAKVDLDSLVPEKMEIPDLSQWDSPPPLHKRLVSPPSSPFAWEFEPVEFILKNEN